MKTIFLFIPDSYISDILRTGYLDYASSKFKFVIFTKNIDQEIGESEYIKSTNINYVKWTTKNKSLFSFLKFLRINGIHQFDYLSGIEQYFKKEIFLTDKRARLIRFITRPLSIFFTVDFLTNLEKKLIKIPNEFLFLIDKYKPDMIVTNTLGLSVFEAEAIIMAKKLKVPTAAINFNWDNLTLQKAHLIRKCDFLLVWNDIVRDQAINIHKYNPKNVFVVGTLRYDHYFKKEEKELLREEFLKSKNLNPEYPTILFTTVSKTQTFQIKWLKDIFILRNSKKIPYSNIFVRLHPNDELDLYKDLLDSKDFFIELAGQSMINKADRIEMRKKDLLNLRYTLMYTDLNINYCSSMSLESILFDKPVINFFEPSRPDLEKTHYKPLIDFGAITVAYDINDYAKKITEFLNDPLKNSFNRRKFIAKYIPFSDGLCYKRSVDKLFSILENKLSNENLK